MSQDLLQEISQNMKTSLRNTKEKINYTLSEEAIALLTHERRCAYLLMIGETNAAMQEAYMLSGNIELAPEHYNSIDNLFPTEFPDDQNPQG